MLGDPGHPHLVCRRNLFWLLPNMRDLAHIRQTLQSDRNDLPSRQARPVMVSRLLQDSLEEMMP